MRRRPLPRVRGARACYTRRGSCTSPCAGGARASTGPFARPARTTRPTLPAASERGLSLDVRAPRRCRQRRSPWGHVMPLEGQLDEPVDQLRVRDPGRFPQLRIHRDRREPGDRVDLVQHDIVALEEEVHARHPRATDRAERLDRVLADLLRDRLGDRRRDEQLAPLDQVLRFVVVELVRGDHLAEPGRFGLVVPEDRAFELTAVDRLLDQDRAVVVESALDTALELERRAALRNPDARPQVRRLREGRKADRVLRAAQNRLRVARELGLAHRDPRRDGDARVREHRLLQRLVHTERAGGDAGSDVGHPQRLEQALNGAVLSAGTVQQDEHEVHGARRAFATRRQHLSTLAQDDRASVPDLRQRALGGSQLAGRAGGQQPLPRLRYRDREDVVLVLIDGRQHAARADDADFVLGRRTTVQNCDAELDHGRACSKSATRSSMSSIPTDTRTIPSVRPIAARCSGVSCVCVTDAGCTTSVFVPPRLAAGDAMRTRSRNLRPAAASPASNASIPPKRSPSSLRASEWSGWLSNPGYRTRDTAGCSSSARASAIALWQMRSTRRTSVCTPRATSHASNGAICPPVSIARRLIAAMRSASPETTPPVTSP